MLVHPAGFPQISLQLSGSAQATRSTIEIFYSSWANGEKQWDHLSKSCNTLSGGNRLVKF